MTGLRYIPNYLAVSSFLNFQTPVEFRKPLAVRAGFEPAVQLPVRQFSKLVVSASHPPHRGVGCKCTKKSFPPNFTEIIFKMADCLSIKPAFKHV
jgi:hypothetical protein